jgi:hypothetical protein
MATNTKKDDTQQEEPREVAAFQVPLNDGPRPARRSGKNRELRFKDNSNSLDKSFTEFLDTSAPDEIEEFTTELQTTLNSLPKEVTESLVNVERRPSGEHYAPVRRPSRAGSELAKSMKEIAAAALLELGDIDDDSHDEINGLGVGDEVKI